MKNFMVLEKFGHIIMFGIIITKLNDDAQCKIVIAQRFEII